ncbi:DNA polymerase Y family protein [Pseudovibrio exalbescens]|uniref:Y-family DNA polymerase n=1 Tax=Pseudovibrio exalbescens TaxID=197461 RepID=UPI0023666E62|nr:DNA polymerase Y family protein [Pseudovibrio exalbescens]MDD7909371.1 DNA polymerase Y family protein [Pseudovibrio exalbescens]
MGPRRLKQRILCLWFPELATDRICRRDRGRSWRSGDAVEPLAVYGKRRNAHRLICINAPARKAGIALGEGLSDACARVPHLRTEEEIPEADEALLAALADWCDRYTPLVALSGDDGLLLDITGCAHLFEGEEALLEDCVTRLSAQGFTVRASVADTVGAAWACARAKGGVIAPGGQREVLEPLPLSLLRLEENCVAALNKVGLKRIVDVLDRPRAPLASRFGGELVRRLDQALGLEGEPISPRLHIPALVAERRFFEPISRQEDMEAIILALGDHIKAQLEERGQGGRAFEVALFRVDGVVNRLMVGTSGPIREPSFILRLFREKLKSVGDELDAGFGYDLVRLSVLEAQSCTPGQLDLSGARDEDEDLAQLVDRLGARLGIARVARFLPGDSHMPEKRAALVPAATVREDAIFWPDEHLLWDNTSLERPLRLLARPEPVEAVAMVPEGPPLRFRWRKALYEVARSEGPERIAPPWWQGPQPTRDYFRVEDSEGRRFWLYREGLFEREVPNPRWFLQGLFS